MKDSSMCYDDFKYSNNFKNKNLNKFNNKIMKKYKKFIKKQMKEMKYAYDNNNEYCLDDKYNTDEE